MIVIYNNNMCILIIITNLKTMIHNKINIYKQTLKKIWFSLLVNIKVIIISNLFYSQLYFILIYVVGNDLRGSQRSEELYLKGLKNKIELEDKAQ